MYNPLNKSISILIPNYNGKELLEKFLSYTFIAAKNSQLLFEIIVIDDASTDDSVYFIKVKYPEIILHVNTTNQGFSKTCNIGMNLAKNKLLLILNSDIQLSPNYFRNQLKYFDDPSTFGVMSRIIDHNNPNHTEKAQTLRRFGYWIKKKRINGSYLQNELYPTVFLSGANALVDLKKIKALGGFNELFSPYYSEDTDLSIRAWRLGWKCYFDNFSYCNHLGSATIKNSEKKRRIKIIYYRNKFILHALHLNDIQVILFNIQTILFAVCPRLFIGKFWIIISYHNYIKQRRDIYTSRKQFEVLMQKHRSSISLFEIKTLIKNLQNK